MMTFSSVGTIHPAPLIIFCWDSSYLGVCVNQNTVMKPMAGPYLWHPVKDSPPGIQPALVSRSQWSRWFLLPCHEVCSCCCVYLWCRSQLIISLINTPPPFPTLPPSSLLLLLCSPQKPKRILYLLTFLQLFSVSNRITNRKMYFLYFTSESIVFIFWWKSHSR